MLSRPGSHPDTAHLIDLIVREQVTVMQLVPSLLGLMVDDPSFPKCTCLKRVFCGGENLRSDIVNRFQRLLPAGLINLYGPTEATIDTHFYVCPRTEHAGFIPIGKPIANTRSYVLDAHDRPAPVGVPGELHIGGTAVGRGYLHREELTAERFICDPFSCDPNARLYKTGDLARVLDTGDVQILGRMDHQVKLRGFRIELGEVEACLRECDGVADAVAIVRDDKGRDARLIAYCVTRPAMWPANSELRRYLKERLPEYMVPSAIVLMDRLPLTPNGKVDRKALPAPDGVRPELETAYVAARSETEQTLVRIWQQVLGLEQVGIHDNFFELGGDSILSIQIIARARQAGLQLTPQQMFQRQTISELAEVAQPLAPEMEIEAGPLEGDVPLLPVQAWFFEQDFADPDHFNQSVLVRIGPGTNAGWLKEALRAITLHHDALRLRYSRQERGWRQWCPAGVDDVPFEEVDLSRVPAGEQAAAIRREAERAQASLDLAAGPLMRVVLMRLGGGQAERLLWVVHHLAVDGVSWRILLEDLKTAVEAVARGEQIMLPARTTSVARWAGKLREYGATAASREAGWWLEPTRQACGRLLVDRSDGENSFGSGRNVCVELSEEETRALLQDVPGVWQTQINDALLAALGQVLANWTGSATVLLDLEGHGREDLFEGVDLSRTVGWFTSIFPVYLRTEGEDAGARLRAVKEQLRRIPNRGLGYGVLRYVGEDAQVRRQLAQQPSAEVSFNYLGQLGPGQQGSLAEADEDGALAGAVRSARAHRAYLLEINASVMSGRLRAFWTYSENRHERATVEALAQQFLKALRDIIRHCQSAQPGYTPSDFRDVELTQGDLDSILNELGVAGGAR